MSRGHSTARFFDDLQSEPPDPLLSLIGLYKEDGRPSKLDLGVGVYRTEAGDTPIYRAVKNAERRLLEGQSTKAYLGPEGDTAFVRLIARLAAGDEAKNLIGLQAPGGAGALRLAAGLIARTRPGSTVWLGTPSWPAHALICAAEGLTVRTYRHYDPTAGTFELPNLFDAIDAAESADIFLLHGCCHNPSGADPDQSQWQELSRRIAAKGVLPLIDLAYQGIGHGLDLDASGARHVLAAVDHAVLAYSCDKNFSLYRDRTGAVFVKAGRAAESVRSNLQALARQMWSMPPDHGAAVARLVLETPDLETDWRVQLAEVRSRLNRVRRALADADPRLSHLASKNGLFALIPLSQEQVETMRREHAIYMASSGRINIAGLTEATIPRFVEAFADVSR
ncbi:MAG: aromatic amino acid transaminase [Alphaproteobacteria bacterium]|nr:aromatic amino acid transaminase [Alphaproteobacteria bacterium]